MSVSLKFSVERGESIGMGYNAASICTLKSGILLFKCLGVNSFISVYVADALLTGLTFAISSICIT